MGGRGAAEVGERSVDGACFPLRGAFVLQKGESAVGGWMGGEGKVGEKVGEGDVDGACLLLRGAFVRREGRRG